MKKIFQLFVFCFSIQVSLAQINTPIIIDTDCAFDDYRAINMMLATKELKILAITTNDGALDPMNGVMKVACLLSDYKLEGIEIDAGRTVLNSPPVWREACGLLAWGQCLPAIGFKQNAAQLIVNQLTKSEIPVTLICLGSLTNVSDAIKLKPEIQKKISRIIWYNNAINPPKGTNYEADTKSADYVISLNLELQVVTNLENKEAYFDKEFQKQISKINTKYAKAVSSSFAQMHNGKAFMWDDLAVVYLLYPELFDLEAVSLKKPNLTIVKNYNIQAVKDEIIKILSQTYTFEKEVTFIEFPTDGNYYLFDVKSEIDTIIKRNGKQEWKATVITNELHGHLGVYSIVGAKMGIKAREILHAPIDRLEVFSFAGNHPPMGCLNDGLQVSTGSTLGYGTFKIANDSINTVIRPEAIFSFTDKTGTRKVRLKLKEKYSQQVEKDIVNGIIQYGNLTAGYWKLVRKLAIQYWRDWDRNEIFDIQEIK